jgi:hypothetical protein
MFPQRTLEVHQRMRLRHILGLGQENKGCSTEEAILQLGEQRAIAQWQAKHRSPDLCKLSTTHSCSASRKDAYSDPNTPFQYSVPLSSLIHFMS